MTNNDKLYKWLALFVVVIGTFMAILDTSIVNVAIPKMMAVFGVTADEIQWILTAYMLTMGITIPLTGFLGDVWGAKKTYIWALIAFTIGSALCGFAWSNSSMIAARIIQALGSGLIMPTSMAIIYQVFPKEERGMALGIWGIAAMAAPSIGPTLSGYIVEHLNWRLIFTLNIPIGVTGVIMAWILLKDMPGRGPRPFDWLGFVSSALGLGCIIYVLGEGGTVDWHDFETVALLVFGFFSLVFFVVHELTIDEPLLDLRILKIWPYSLSIIISSIVNIALFGGVFLLPLFLQNIQGYTAMQTGMLMFPGAVATGLMMPISGKLFDRFGAKPVVIPGLIILTWSTYELAHLSVGTSADSIMWLLAIRGVGMGLAMMPATTAGMNSVPPQLVPGASALNNVIRQVASSIGLTVLTTIMTNLQTLNYTRVAEQLNYFDYNSTSALKLLQGLFVQQGYNLAESQATSLSVLTGLVQKQVALQAINDTLLVTAFIALLTVPLSFFIKGRQPHQETPAAHVIME